MNIKSIIASLFMLGLLASCAPSINVKHDYDPKVNVRQFSTFRVEADQRRNADPIAGSNLNQRRIADAIEKSMQAKGYKPVVGGEADLVIRFFSDSKDRQQVQSNNTWSPYWMWYNPGYNNVYTRQYEENRVVINVYDARTNDIIWQGWATGQLNQSKKDRNRDVAYRTTVDSIMKQLPESAGSDYSSVKEK
ncbi:DUF4136 domain-containing protein [Larkinella insperata]|uniref:DUF4136 domain-containing protein n=1 Tax=Larkinella insperata TaxID=332158 RepID=A0ABW3QLP1_9BACT|nr:DUF4136 domain-containing protein [Larkinella insperata]